MAFCAYCGSSVAEVSYKPCPSCARPTNGAPLPPAAKSTNTAGIVIGVIVGAFVIVAVIGILAAIAIPNLLTAMQRAKQKRTMADMRSMAAAVETYATQKNALPADLQSVSGPSKDAWEQPIQYECWSDQQGGACNHYALGSGGKDMRFDHESLREYASGTTRYFDCDIVLADGAFVQYPDTAGGR